MKMHRWLINLIDQTIEHLFFLEGFENKK